MEEEIWRDVVGYEKYYQVSNLARVKSLSRTTIGLDSIYTTKEKILKKAKQVTLSKDGISKKYYVSALMKKAFKDDLDLIYDKDLINENIIINENIFEGQSYERNRGQRKVKCITTGKEFPSINQANIYYNISDGEIARCCKGVRKSAGKLEDGTKLQWMYINDENNNNNIKDTKNESGYYKDVNMFNLVKRLSDEILRKEILSHEAWSSEDIDLLNELRQGKFDIESK